MDSHDSGNHPLVEFRDGGVSLGTVPISWNGAGLGATLSVAFSQAGDHSITARYSGDSAYAAAVSAAFIQRVQARVATTTSLSATPNPAPLGSSVMIGASVSPAAATGSVEFRVDGAPIATVAVAGGQASLNYSSMTAGHHAITAAYSGDDTYDTSSSQPLTQVVTTTTQITLTAAPSPSNAGSYVTFRALISPSAATGSAQFLDGTTVLGSATLDQGLASFSISTLAAGDHSITAVYNGDGAYLGSASNVVVHTVLKRSTSLAAAASPNPVAYGQGLTLSATITPWYVTGQIQFKDGGTTLGTAPIVSGFASLYLSNVAVGNHSIVAVYDGDDIYLGSTSAPIALTVSKADPSLSVSASPSPSTFGQQVMFRASVASAATGTVVFREGSTTLGTVTVANGSAYLQISTFAAGSHSISVDYGGDGSYLSRSASMVQDVTKDNSSVTVYASPNPSTYGQPVTLSASVSPVWATGSVQFQEGANTLGTATLVNSAASVTIPALPLGSHSITAVYSGDASCLGATSAAVGLTVQKATTAVTVSSSPNPSAFGQAVTFTASVAPAGATGTIRFTDGGAVLGTVTLVNGTAALAVPSLTAGSHYVNALYSGDDYYLASGAQIVQNVQKATAAVTVGSSLNPSVFGQAVTLTVSVAPAGATGSIQFMDGAAALGTTPLTNGAATLITPSLAAGSHSITAVYSGDASNQGATSAVLVQTVQKATATATVGSSPNPSASGQAVTLTASVAPAGATGSVVFRDGAAALGTAALMNGVAALPIPGLAAGNHSITAVYSGDASYQGATSAALVQTVQKAAAAVTVGSSPNPSGFGQVVTLTASVSPAGATGSIQFRDGAAALGTAPLVNGVAALPILGLSVGNHSIAAVYNGDASYLGATSPALAHSVVKANPAVAAGASPNPAVVGQTVTLTATVSPAAAPGSVRFSDGRVTLGTATLTNGIATLAVTRLDPGNHSISAAYSGDGNFNPAASSALTLIVNRIPTTTTLTSGDNPVRRHERVTFTARVSPAAATGTVRFLEGSRLLGSASLSGGTARLTVDFSTEGTHSITADYGGSANYDDSTSAPVIETVRH